MRCHNSPLSLLLGHSIPRSAGNSSLTLLCDREDRWRQRLHSPAAGGLDNTSLVGLGVVRVPAPAAATWSEHHRQQAPDHRALKRSKRKTTEQRELHALASHPCECPARKTTLPGSGRSCPIPRVHARPVLLPRELRIQVRDLASPIAAAEPCRRRALRHRCYMFPQTAHARSHVPLPHRNVSRVSFIALG